MPPVFEGPGQGITNFMHEEEGQGPAAASLAAATAK
jgi:hypothetical protein